MSSKLWIFINYKAKWKILSICDEYKDSKRKLAWKLMIEEDKRELQKTFEKNQIVDDLKNKIRQFEEILKDSYKIFWYCPDYLTF